MTDYRVRNHDFLYADRRPQPLNWRNVVIFGAIGVTVIIGVAGQLTDRVDLTPPGFPAAPALAEQQAPLIQAANPASSKFGS